jgi:sugar phosphate isomerase/epimerase
MIYLSTGAFQNQNFYKTANKYFEKNINYIELSQGKFTRNIENKLNKLEKKKIKFIFHNYFPVPEKPFIINLASSDEKILNQSIDHFKKVINLSSKYNIKYVSVHAGFKVNFLKNTFNIKNLSEVEIIEDKIAENNFINSIKIISKIAKKKRIEILIENNVLSKKNYYLFKFNPFLFSESKNIKKIINQLPKNVGLLLDTGHLKVSAKTLGLNLFDEYVNIFKFIKGYHLNDNNGKLDSNKEFTKNAWWFKKFNKNLDYYTIEVYQKNISRLKKQIEILNNILINK